jgi:hypothetical protein
MSEYKQRRCNDCKRHLLQVDWCMSQLLPMQTLLVLRSTTTRHLSKVCLIFPAALFFTSDAYSALYTGTIPSTVSAAGQTLTLVGANFGNNNFTQTSVNIGGSTTNTLVSSNHTHLVIGLLLSLSMWLETAKKSRLKLIVIVYPLGFHPWCHSFIFNSSNHRHLHGSIEFGLRNRSYPARDFQYFSHFWSYWPDL